MGAKLHNKFESIHIDLNKRIFKINDEDMDEGVFRLVITYEDCVWSVEQSSDKNYIEERNNNVKHRIWQKSTKK